jgi:hypothetical protein
LESVADSGVGNWTVFAAAPVGLVLRHASSALTDCAAAPSPGFGAGGVGTCAAACGWPGTA